MMQALVRLIDSFASPGYLVLLVLPLLYVVLLLMRRTQRLARTVSGEAMRHELPVTWRTIWVEGLPWLQVLILSLVIVALARPASGKRAVTTRNEAVDIVLVLDTSSSMRQKDLAPNTTRIEVVRRFADSLVQAREGDRIALVTFARFGKVVAPLTFDREAIRKLVGRIRVVELQVEDGTAIGVGLGAAVRRIRDSRAESKVIVLLTDGENNTGEVSPLEAAQLAKDANVRVHTILAGTGRRIPNPFGRARVIEPGTQDLEKIAEMTGGHFFRARSAEALAQVGAAIDKMERTPVDDLRIHVEEERFRRPLVPATMLLLLTLFVNAFFVRHLP